MLTYNQLQDIKNKLKKGEEITITCKNFKRLVELEKQTFNFSGKLRLKVIGE